MKYTLTKEEKLREKQMLIELTRLHTESQSSINSLACINTKKRTRIPKVQPNINPFCMERQLADEYQRQNFNKNPKYYTQTLDTAPSRANPHNHSTLMNDYCETITNRYLSRDARAEFSVCLPPTTNKHAALSVPSVISVDSSDMRYNSQANQPPREIVHEAAKKEYGRILTSQCVSFGHRPKSASRMYNPLTDGINNQCSTNLSLTSKDSQLSPVSRSQSVLLSPLSSSVQENLSKEIYTGMSLAALQQLLSSSHSRSTKNLVKNGRRKHRNKHCSKSNANQNDKHIHMSTTGNECAIGSHDKLEEMEKKYYNKVYLPPPVRKSITNLPPTDQTTAQLIHKYRKMAIGAVAQDERI